MDTHQQYWNTKHTNEYQHAQWVSRPNPFAMEAAAFFPQGASLLELGCGQGQDTGYFLREGYAVTATDFSPAALEEVQKKFEGVDTFQGSFLDLRSERFPWEDALFDGVYAHLSLHYFTAAETHHIFSEIHRLLKPQGVLAFLVNTLRDPEVARGTLIEPEYFMMPMGIQKRFFSPESVLSFTDTLFATALLDEQGRTEKDALEGDYGLIRYVGRKEA